MSTQRINTIFDRASFLPVFSADVKSAIREIVIVSPYIRKTRLTQMIELLSSCSADIAISVVTRPPDNYKQNEQEIVALNIKSLQNANVNVVLKPDIHQKFTVIDQIVVWYGSINFLSFGNSKESIMRLESSDIASELLGVLD
jgi:phosphatidylserine/phosphatidylglycerophosphate/cardiolipin synthase-like enzyme